MFQVTQYAGFSASRPVGTASAPNTGNLVAWYDFSDVANLNITGTRITSIVDKSTNSATATTIIAGTLTSQPHVALNYAGTLGAGNFRQGGTSSANTTNAPWMVATNSIAFGTNGVSILAVGQEISTAGNNAYLSYHGSGALGATIVQQMAKATSTSAAWSGYEMGAATSTFTNPTTLHLFSGTTTYDAGAHGTGRIRIDGGTDTATRSSNSVGADSANYHGIGALGGVATGSSTNPWTGYIGEIRVFGTALGTDDLYKEEGYLAWKWGIQTQLPLTHPYRFAPP